MANIQPSIGFAFTIQQKFNLEKAINEANPYLEINYMDGGVEIYDAIIGLV